MLTPVLNGFSTGGNKLWHKYEMMLSAVALMGMLVVSA